MAVFHLSMNTRGYDMIQFMHSSERQPILSRHVTGNCLNY